MGEESWEPFLYDDNLSHSESILYLSVSGVNATPLALITLRLICVGGRRRCAPVLVRRWLRHLP
ncbi:MAG: hypothetical protein RLZZ505_289 [Verrucomicrobiota bacterium]|jgi:hypothetical protein